MSDTPFDPRLFMHFGKRAHGLLICGGELFLVRGLGVRGIAPGQGGNIRLLVRRR